MRGAGYRLVYQVQDDRVVVFVVAVGKREREEV
ncbi:type II toxin-antitoxin system RelE/ParE family toxin, partial [Aeromonas caviae]